MKPITENGVTIQFNRELDSLIDSRQMAEMLGIQHESFIKNISEHESALSELGVFRFEIGKPQKGSKGGRPETYALLNENQAFFAVTLSRNTPQAVKAKLLLVKAFAAARNLIEAQHGYLESHKKLHATIGQMQAIALQRGSNAPPFAHHVNLERLNNKLLGIPKDSRATLNRKQKQVLETLAEIEQTAINKTLANGGNDKAAYHAAKEQAQAFMQQYGNALLGHHSIQAA
ncbi:Rha family transcriptional regulator [Alysiella crassa]|uniref:Uncharacterized phage-encoded protein n=1 Tax=Alysiella crassa TaxID=153491 RepID=A0A376BLN4_9NEIS|nr:Rha family transcriptional regulator [Alysiella crassa]UOP07647.1 Rha family transcriptional regulator [Alysiella crassa]SSY70124.1 Uncharacterized phage-encoded protein [Alysiella crassa]